MKVTIVDRELQARLWGNGYRSIHDVICTIEIANTCPVCGAARGAPSMRRFCEDDEWYNVSVWNNPCGHLDAYANVIKEARVASDAD